ncbi:hypothetical protein MLD38_032351 [Melastoma candidum]|uniref:Uncharacterized protein n=1 Tax=Melastoma candidum TaxID=119954 RepID=A0ACB9M4M6_9MYRT|nr:hypothetical protein MLD38_032351 [Melastoma candidum]
MDMELIMKLIYAGCVLPRVLRTSHVLFYPKASQSNPDEEQKKIGEEEKSEEEYACQKDEWFLFAWRIRVRLVYCELHKLFPKAFPGEVHMRQETVLDHVIGPCEDTTSLIFKDSIHQGLPSPVFGDALGCCTTDMDNAVGDEHAINLQTMTIKADGLPVMNKHLKLEVVFLLVWF